MWQQIKDESPKAWAKMDKSFGELSPGDMELWYILDPDEPDVYTYIHPAEVVEWLDGRGIYVTIFLEYPPVILQWFARVTDDEKATTEVLQQSEIEGFPTRRAAMMAGIRRAFAILEKRLEGGDES